MLTKTLLYIKKLTDICVFYSNWTKVAGKHFLRFNEKFEQNYSGSFYKPFVKIPLEFLKPDIIYTFPTLPVVNCIILSNIGIIALEFCGILTFFKVLTKSTNISYINLLNLGNSIKYFSFYQSKSSLFSKCVSITLSI
jgi:hypothetical protein